MQPDLKLSLQLAEMEAQAQTILAPRFVPQVPHPRQRMFLDLKAEEILFGGMAGGGKSSSLLMKALQYVDVPGYAAIIFRRTLTDLKLAGALLDRSHHWLASTPARWNGDSKRWTFPSGATLSFGYLEHENDKFRYQSAEFQGVFFDELSQFTDSQYLYLFSRLRRPAMPCVTCGDRLELKPLEGVWVHEEGSDGDADHLAQPDQSVLGQYPRSHERNLSVFDVPLQMASGTNPGGVGSEWVRERFIPDDFMPEDAIDPKVWTKAGIGSDEQPFKTFFVPSRLEDNAYADQKSYGRMLSKLGRVEYAQLAKGDWTITAVGRMRFDADAIAKFTPRRGTDGELFIDSDSKGTIPGVPPIFFRPQEGGATSIWKPPERGHLYAAGADTAEGKDANKGQGTAKGDWSVCQIRDADSGEQVARFRGRVRERAFAVQLWMILTWYNRAFLVPEIGGGYGRAMLDHLVLDLMYPMAHIYRRSGNTAGASPLNIEIDDLGWPTGATTRPRLVSALDTAILTHSIETYDPITLNEYRSFEVSKAGKDEARTGTHDDAVMADALCVIGIQEFPPMLRRAQALTRPQIVKYAVPQGNAAQMEAQRLMDERRRRM